MPPSKLIIPAGSDFTAPALPKRQAKITLCGEAGTGKCLGKGTPVLMFDGSIRQVETIVTGEVLMGPDSEPRHVLSTATGRDQLFRIVPVKGAPWVCNSEHMLTLVNSTGFKTLGSQKSGALYDIALDQFLALPRSHQRAAKLVRSDVDFPSRSTLIRPYILGVWLGDGHRGTSIITVNEPEIIEEYRREAERLGMRLSTLPDKRCNTARWAIVGLSRYGAGRVNPFQREILRCEEEGEKTIPRDYLVNDRESRLELLAGLIDTDGHLSSGGFEIVTKSGRLRDGILFLSQSLGFAAHSRPKIGTIDGRPVGTYYRIFISGDVSVVPCRNPLRKAQPRRQKKSVLRTGFKVEPIGEGDYFGFELDGDGRFLLGDFTITHNTTFALKYAPDPIALINFDGRARYAAQEAVQAGKRILMTEVRISGDINRMGEDPAKKAGQVVIDKTMKNLEAAVRESQKGNVRTICFDTGTEYGQFCTLAFRGKLGLVKDYGKSKDLINQQLLRIYQLVADGDAHLIMLTRAKSTWAGEEPTGEFEPRAYEVLSEAADIVAHLRFRKAGKGKVSKESEIRILKAGTDRSQLGAVYREGDWEDLGGPFVYSCLMNYPGTTLEDWQ